METITPMTVVFPSIVFALAFFLGWLTGHIRDNATTQALMDKIEALKEQLAQREYQLRCSIANEAKLEHVLEAANQTIARKDGIIKILEIGQESKPEQPPMPDEIPDELLTAPHL